MNLILKHLILICLFSILTTDLLNAQNNEKTNIDYKNAIEIGPMGDIYMAAYTRKLSKHDEIVLGGGYLNSSILSMIEYPGISKVFFVQTGYRRYLWKDLNVEFQLMPNYSICKDTLEQKTYKGFGLTPEIRLGYRFEFSIKNLPVLINLQWFAGYQLISVKPESFIEVDGGSFYISPIPIVLLGFRF